MNANAHAAKSEPLHLDAEGAFLHPSCLRLTKPADLVRVPASELLAWRITYGENATCEVCGK